MYTPHISCSWPKGPEVPQHHNHAALYWRHQTESEENREERLFIIEIIKLQKKEWHSRPLITYLQNGLKDAVDHHIFQDGVLTDIVCYLWTDFTYSVVFCRQQTFPYSHQVINPLFSPSPDTEAVWDRGSWDSLSRRHTEDCPVSPSGPAGDTQEND